jgi:DNA-directed RNA polymerase subunit beta'
MDDRKLDEQKVNLDFSGLQIRLASPENINTWSRGEVTKPETINYRTFRPEKDGLFDERIFGPTKDYECYCGKYKRIRYKGIVCDRCGVEVTTAVVRRERMGHIKLSTPIAHVWYFKGANAPLAILLDIPTQMLERIVYYAAYLVTGIHKEKQQTAQETLQKFKNEELAQVEAQFETKRAELAKEYEAQKQDTAKKITKAEQRDITLSEIDLKEREAHNRRIPDCRSTRHHSCYSRRIRKTHRQYSFKKKCTNSHATFESPITISCAWHHVCV